MHSKTTAINYPGLDFLRTCAILLVFMYHYMCFSGQHNPFGMLAHTGWLGVDLFFALSGYLIGNQIIECIHLTQDFSLAKFYIRRCLRILPNYVLVIALYYWIPTIREHPMTMPWWQFLTFTANLNYKICGFSHAWSLSLEMQFYLIMPLIILLLEKKFPKYKSYLWSFFIGSMLLTAIFLRLFRWIYYIQHAHDAEHALYFAYIYTPMFTRIDALLLGLTIAIIKNNHTNIWSKIINRTNFLLLIAYIGWMTVIYWFQYRINEEALPTIFAFFLFGITSALLICIAINPTTLLHRANFTITKNIALLAYALYLINIPIIVLVRDYFDKQHINYPTLQLLITTLLWFIAGGIIYHFVEFPFLKLRHKLRL
jgi:peptidoglycan/LPS O-acetylase OafA/YrhL